MDLNFASTKKGNTTDSPTGEQMSGTQNLLGDLQWRANEHVEDGSSADIKDFDFEHIDPQQFVQRMSADAKEAQEHSDAKFAQTKNDFNDFLGQTKQNLKQGVASLTHDFMNAERGGFPGVDHSGNDKMDFFGKSDISNTMNNKNLLSNSSHAGKSDGNFTMPQNIYNNNLIDDLNVVHDIDPIMPVANQKLIKTTINKDSDTDSPSISYNPSPAKKLPKTDALKEQDNDKFISSEDLLSDFDERNSKLMAMKQKQGQQQQHHEQHEQHYTKGTPIIDLDADDDDEDDFIQAEIPKISEESIQLKPDKIIKPTPITSGSNENKPNIPNIDMKTNKMNITTAPVMSVGAASAPIKPSTKVQQQTQIISVEDIFYKYGLDAWFKPERLHPQVESLIYWRDVKKSGVVFGAGLFTLLAISCFSVISVFAYLSLMVLCGTTAFRIYKSVMQAIQKTSDGHPFKEYLEHDLTLSQDKVQHIAGIAVAHLNGFISEMRRLFLVEDLVDSIKFGVILCVMTCIGAWFNGMTLVLMAFVSLFTLPKVYENNKQSIDTYLDLARSKVAEVTEKIKAAIPLGTKKPLAATETDKDK